MRKNKITACLLASTIVLSSCGNKEQNNNQTISVDDLLCTEIVYSEEEVLDNLEKVYDEYINNHKNFDLMGREDVLDASFLYHNITERGLKGEEVIPELNKILEFSITNTKMTEEEYDEAFKNLLKTYGPEVESVYYPLAKCMHLYSCPLVHEEHDFVITCDDLQKYNSAATIEGYEDYVSRTCLTSEDTTSIRLPYLRLYHSEIELSVLLDELNSVYYFGQVPTEIGYEWDLYFSGLESTLEEGESLFDTYYDLAVFIHTLTCDYEHTLNEYDAYVCDNMKLTKIWEE